MQAQVIMIASGKGGTGKSTVSVLLGAQLASLGKRVLLVELDSGLRSVDLMSGVYGKTVYDVEDILSGRCSPEKAVVESPLYRNLFVISAPYSGGNIHPQALTSFVYAVRSAFDFILLDTAAGMGMPFVAAAAVAKTAVLVITPDPVTVRDGRIVADALFEIGEIEVRLLMNKVPRTMAGTGLADLDECIDTVGAQLIGVLPYSDDMIKASSTGARLPASSKIQRALTAVAIRLCGRETPLIIA